MLIDQSAGRLIERSEDHEVRTYTFCECVRRGNPEPLPPAALTADCHFVAVAGLIPLVPGWAFLPGAGA